MSSRILIVDQCSGSKSFPNESPVFDASEIDSVSKDALLERDGVAAVKARELYTGRQQSFISDAVNRLRETGYTVDRWFVSAGFGLVAEEELLPPYEVTFNGMTGGEIDERAAALDISKHVQELVRNGEYEYAFFALGKQYYRAIDLDEIVDNRPEESTLVVFNGETIVDGDGVLSISARNEDAKEHGTIVVALKGKFLQYFANHLAAGKTIEGPEDIYQFCTTDLTSQSHLDSY